MRRRLSFLVNQYLKSYFKRWRFNYYSEFSKTPPEHCLSLNCVISDQFGKLKPKLSQKRCPIKALQPCLKVPVTRWDRFIGSQVCTAGTPIPDPVDRRPSSSATLWLPTFPQSWMIWEMWKPTLPETRQKSTTPLSCLQDCPTNLSQVGY